MQEDRRESKIHVQVYLQIITSIAFHSVMYILSVGAYYQSLLHYIHTAEGQRRTVALTSYSEA